MKKIALILTFISSLAFACGDDFPKQLECRHNASIDGGVAFKFYKLDSGDVEMEIYELGIAGDKLLVSDVLEVRGSRLKNDQFKAKFSNNFKKLKRFKSKDGLNKADFICL